MSNNNIALTASMRSNLLSLQNTQSLMNKTQDRLSTGYKVNSAMDNPSSYFTAQALNSRANDLSSLLDSIGQAISTLEVADEGITTLQDFVEQAKSIANSARDTSNVSASSTSSVKFNPDTLRSDLVTNQVNGLTPGNSSMTIRLGDATKLDGLTNVSEETALSNLGIGTTGASDIGTLSIDGKAYTIDASGTTKQMTNVSSYGEKSVLKITDGSNLTEAKVEDAAGNKYVLDLTNVAGATSTGYSTWTEPKQITVNAGAEGAIKATIAEDGKTTWELTDASAWKTVATETKTASWTAGTTFEISSVTRVAGTNKVKISLADGNGDAIAGLQNIEVTNDKMAAYADGAAGQFNVISFTDALTSETNADGDELGNNLQSLMASGFTLDAGSTSGAPTVVADITSGDVAAGGYLTLTVAAGSDLNHVTITVEDVAANSVSVEVEDAAMAAAFDADNSAFDDLIIKFSESVTLNDGTAAVNQANLKAAFDNGHTFARDAAVGTATTVDAASRETTTTVQNITDRPIKDLTGAARDIKGTYTYTVKAGETATFKVSDADTTAGTATLTDAEGNVFKNVKLTGAAGLATGSTEIVLDNTGVGAEDIAFSLSKAENDVVVAAFDDNGNFDWSSLRNGTTAGTAGADADAEGTMVNANTVFIDNGGTVGDMAETLQNMIGNTRLSVSVEDSNLKLKTLDTSSLEVKDGSVLGTNGTANGVGFATAFGLDVGQTIKLDASDTAESLRQKVEQMSRNMRDGRSVTAEFDTNGHMIIKSSEGDDMVISGELADRLGVSGKSTNGSNERAIYSQQFNNVLTQIDQLVQDTSYKGINLLKGDNLTVNFNESRTSTIELKGVNFDATGLGFTQAQNEWRTNANIDKSLEQITKATSMLRAQASEFGQNLSTVQIREDFTKNMINNLQSGADKLTLADMNEEAANMLALQTRQQLGVNSLSLASQASQSVLKLF